jgi:hypothetical protein
MALAGTTVNLNDKGEVVAENQNNASEQEMLKSFDAIQESLNNENKSNSNNGFKTEYVNKNVDETTAEYAKNLPPEFVKRKQKKFKTLLVNIPSEGKFYSKNSSCYGISQIEVRQLSAVDEDILFSRKLLQNGKVFDTLLNNVMISNIKVDDLLSTDKSAILLALRINAYGADYDSGEELFCTNCEARFKYSFDLNSLSPKELKNNNEFYVSDDGTFELKIPSGNAIKMKYLTSKDEQTVDEEIASNKRSNKNKNIDHSFTIRLKNQIVSIDGNSDKSFIKDFINDGSMSVQDTRYIRKFLIDNMPEIEMRAVAICPECFAEFESDIAITREFFYPSI